MCTPCDRIIMCSLVVYYTIWTWRHLSTDISNFIVRKQSINSWLLCIFWLQYWTKFAITNLIGLKKKNKLFNNPKLDKKFSNLSDNNISKSFLRLLLLSNSLIYFNDVNAWSQILKRYWGLTIDLVCNSVYTIITIQP